MRIARFLFLVFSASAAAQGPDSVGATVSGVVYDSVSQAPLAGATVQLIAADGVSQFTRTAASDSLGSYSLRGIPEGRFTIGFFHAMLDSLGIDAPLRQVSVMARESVRVDLAIPSAARIRSAICGSPSTQNSSAVVVGFVRDVHTQAPLTGATVIGEWAEISFGPKGFTRRVPHLITITRSTGWFALCELPTAGALALSASLGADSTDRIELQIPTNRFLHHDLYLEVLPSAASQKTAKRTGSVSPPGDAPRSGEGHISGSVVTAAGAKPVSRAEVSIVGGPKTHTNERGEWTLTGAPFGTRLLDVRAVGFYPVRTPVNIIDASTSVRITLSTFQAVLDTVRVNATAPSFDQSGFLLRRRSSGGGHFLTQQDIARRQPVVTSDLFRTIPGLGVERDASGPAVIKMRGTFEDKCIPAIYIDGAYMPDFSADDVDDFTHPDEVAGIEVYTGAALPPQFQKALSGCGSIVIWTKRHTRE
jgi:carboxypeptidase family protein/carboxypeptidase-like protein/TonB-dependent receptor-like protein